MKYTALFIIYQPVFDYHYEPITVIAIIAVCNSEKCCD